MIFRLTRANEITLLRLQLSTSRIKDEKFDDVLREAHSESKHVSTLKFQHKDIINASNMSYARRNKTKRNIQK